MRGIMADREKRGSQWDRWKIRVSRRVGGAVGNNMLTSDRYHFDQGEERNPMG
jgi:hypothetical protein